MPAVIPFVDALADAGTAVREHPVFGMLDRPGAVAALLEHHVFAVWDFATVVDVWRRRVALPPVDVDAYVAAMGAAGADTGPIRRFTALVGAGVDVRAALVMAEAPATARRFVTQSWHTLTTGSTIEQAALLCFGRDELAPPALRRALAGVAPVADWLARCLPAGHPSGDATLTLLASLCRTADDRLLAEATAREVLAARVRLWNAVAAAVTTAAVPSGAR